MMMIEFKQVSKIFQQGQKSITALDNISMRITKNEFFGLVGVSGSGKSTLLRMINHLEVPTTGEVIINNQRFDGKKTLEKRKLVQKIGMIFQQFNLLQNLTVRKNVALALKIQHQVNDERVNNMLSFVGMLEHGDKYPSQLSGGQKQRVAIARALVTQPSILLCDEPTSALDEQNGHEVMALLKKIQQEFGTTIVLVSHELNLIKQWCDRAAIMEEGKMMSVVDVTPIDVKKEDISYYIKAKRYLS